MIAYLDSSVLLRVVLAQPDRIRRWGSIKPLLTSALTKVECLRTLDRFRLTERLTDEEFARKRDELFSAFEGLEFVAVTATVLARAADPFPTVLGTLDAIHLATALLWRAEKSQELVMATHDSALALAARSFGFDVAGT